MQSNIHPEYNNVAVKCSCGNAFDIGSTMDKSSLNIEVCNLCHPFYTGKQKIVDTAGRVDKFKSKFGNLQDII